LPILSTLVDNFSLQVNMYYKVMFGTLKLTSMSVFVLSNPNNWSTLMCALG